jgi:hypothetical protein
VRSLLYVKVGDRDRVPESPEVIQLVKAGKPYSFQESYVEFLKICSHYIQYAFGPMALECQETGGTCSDRE